MRYLIIYDITDDNLRTKVAEILKNYGLRRIQYSGFIGELRRSKLNSLKSELRQLLRGPRNEKEVRNVQIYPLCDACFRSAERIGELGRYAEREREKKPIVL